MGWMIKKLFLFFCLMLLMPVYTSASYKGLHPPMEIEPELLGSQMVFVKGGCYEMGDTFGDGQEDERPVHTVCVDDFYMGKYEVTQKEWVALMGSNPSSYNKRCDNCPVETVSWNIVQEFIDRLNSKSGRNYRLPTESEWEYAARSGGKKERFAGFSEESQLYLYANFCDRNCDLGWKLKNQSDGYRDTSPVGSYKPNGLGLYDMTGNVSEWVSDWYSENYYKESPKDNPKGPSSGIWRLVRGGSCQYNPEDVRAYSRYWIVQTSISSKIGLRLALSPR